MLLLNWGDHLLFLLIGVLIPWRTLAGGQHVLKDITFDTRMKLSLYWGNNLWMWLLTAAVCLVWWLSARSWALLGFQPAQGSNGSWALLAAAIFSLLYLTDTLSDVLTPRQRSHTRQRLREDLAFLPATAKEFFHYIFLALTAGICEEIIFRAYFIRYFQVIFASIDPTHTLAIVTPALIFGAVHFYQGWQAVVKVMSMAVLFGYIYVHTNSLWVVMGIHAGIDLIGGALAWWLLGAKAHPTEEEE